MSRPAANCILYWTNGWLSETVCWFHPLRRWYPLSSIGRPRSTTSSVAHGVQAAIYITPTSFLPLVVLLRQLLTGCRVHAVAIAQQGLALVVLLRQFLTGCRGRAPAGARGVLANPFFLFKWCRLRRHHLNTNEVVVGALLLDKLFI